ncbi:MAG: 16S rRNA (guanine(527)-N(7))-methyltransferase RsmG [Rickettsiales bacterium]|jgi:16S rRNA (guanine527-N7)-methyltransferase|nr:16S rRNA (guanine(527)-N(7))-methyltransferase RsmG [Rickettsiales bacterium]
MKYDKKIQEQFNIFSQMLRNWSLRYNLVARTTLNDIEIRHITDSAQLADFLPHDKQIIDLGSGAGFPAVVLAIMGFNVIAIESVGKKINFLSAVKTELKLDNLVVINDRIENYLRATKSRNIIFTARAFANLTKIFDLTKNVRGAGYALLKGRSVMDEISDAQTKYKFNYKLTPSITGDGFILTIPRIG